MKFDYVFPDSNVFKPKKSISTRYCDTIISDLNYGICQRKDGKEREKSKEKKIDGHQP